MALGGAHVTEPASGTSWPASTLQQGGLAGAVGPDDADPLPGRDREGHVGQHRPRAEREGDASGVHGCHDRPSLTARPSTVRTQ